MWPFWLHSASAFNIHTIITFGIIEDWTPGGKNKPEKDDVEETELVLDLTLWSRVVLSQYYHCMAAVEPNPYIVSFRPILNAINIPCKHSCLHNCR